MIPVFINNRNRLNSTRAMVEYLHQISEARIVIVDNDSTWQPLLDWYASLECGNCGDIEIVRLGRNAGPYAPWTCHRGMREMHHYVVSDSDLDLSRVPLDVLNRLKDGLDRFPQAVKAGLSLEIEDLPPESPFHSHIHDWELKFWKEKLSPEWWWGMVDTTFAMYRPGSEWPGYHNSLRADRPYTAKHLLWYLTDQTITEEDRYYLANCEHGFSCSREHLVRDQQFQLNH